MKLRFHARGDQLAAYPNQWLTVGQPKRYIGRDHVPAEMNPVTGLATKPASNPASKDAAEFEAGSPEGERAASFCRDGALWPADRETAAYCRVSFSPVKFSDGEWVESPAADKPKKD